MSKRLTSFTMIVALVATFTGVRAGEGYAPNIAEKDYVAVAMGYRYRSTAIQDDPADTGAGAPPGRDS